MTKQERLDRLVRLVNEGLTATRAKEAAALLLLPETDEAFFRSYRL